MDIDFSLFYDTRTRTYRQCEATTRKVEEQEEFFAIFASKKKIQKYTPLTLHIVHTHTHARTHSHAHTHTHKHVQDVTGTPRPRGRLDRSQHRHGDRARVRFGGRRDHLQGEEFFEEEKREERPSDET